MSEKESHNPCLIDPRVECTSGCALHAVASAKLLYAEKHRNVDDEGVIIADLRHATLFESAKVLTKNIKKLDGTNQLRKCREFAMNEIKG